jgi:hypothetical protein
MAINFSFENTIEYMQQIGFYEYVLPFILIFGIFFAILEKTKVFGNKRTNINVMVSSVVGLLLIVQQDIVAIINDFLPRVSLILVVIIVLLVVVNLIAGKSELKLKGTVFAAAFGITTIFVLIALGQSTGIGGSFLSDREINNLLSIALPILILMGAMWFVSRPTNSDEPNRNLRRTNRRDRINALFGLDDPDEPEGNT